MDQFMARTLVRDRGARKTDRAGREAR